MKTFDLRAPAFIENPYPTYRAMRDQAPVWREPFTGHVFVTRNDDVLSVLKDSRFSSNRIADRMKRIPPEVNTEDLQRMLADRLVMTDGDRHRDLRREVGSAFTAAMVRTYARQTESTIQQAFERFSESETLDVLDDLALPIPSQVISRIATEDLELGGAAIAEGDMLALVLGSANRDERVFTDADSFNVRRKDRQHLAFGHGSHFCTGRGLASLEVAMIFRHVVPLLPKARIVSGPIQWRPTPAFRSPMALSIEFDTVAITIAEFGGNW